MLNTAKAQPGDNVVVFGLGGIGLNVIQGAKLAGAGKIVGIDINPEREDWGRRFGMTDFVNTRGMSREDTIAAIAALTDGGADYSFDCTGNTEVMRTALECCHRGWGTSIVIGVAEAGKEIATRPFQLVTGRNWRGTAFGGAKGRTDVPKIVDMYMDGKIAIDPMITHVLTLDEINKGFDLMHAGESIRSVVVYDCWRQGDPGEKLLGFSEHWAPRIVARYEGHEVRLAKLEGEFDWHSHTHDELFLIVSGELDIELRDRTETLGPGELIVIPRGTEHRPVARKGEVAALLLDPADSPNTETRPPPLWRWRLNKRRAICSIT